MRRYRDFRGADPHLPRAELLDLSLRRARERRGRQRLAVGASGLGKLPAAEFPEIGPQPREPGREDTRPSQRAQTPRARGQQFCTWTAQPTPCPAPRCLLNLHQLAEEKAQSCRGRFRQEEERGSRYSGASHKVRAVIHACERSHAPVQRLTEIREIR